MNQWISVENQLPLIGQSVLVCVGEEICIAFIQSLKKRFTQINTWDDWIHEDVKWWMPLPEMP